MFRLLPTIIKFVFIFNVHFVFIHHSIETLLISELYEMYTFYTLSKVE